MRRARTFLLGLTIIHFGAACAGGRTPPDTSPLAENGVVGGTVQTSLVAGAPVPQVLVSVAGTTGTANVNRLGEFVLSNVPAGTLELRFTGDNIAASLPLGEIAAGETISVNVHLTPQAATVEAISRVRGTEAMVEGTIETPGTDLPPNTIIVGGRTITVPAGVIPANGAALKPGIRVRVTGTAGGAGVVARQIEIR